MVFSVNSVWTRASLSSFLPPGRRSVASVCSCLICCISSSSIGVTVGITVANDTASSGGSSPSGGGGASRVCAWATALSRASSVQNIVVLIASRIGHAGAVGELGDLGGGVVVGREHGARRRVLVGDGAGHGATVDAGGVRAGTRG